MTQKRVLMSCQTAGCIIMNSKVYKDIVLRPTTFAGLPANIHSITLNKCSTADWKALIDTLSQFNSLKQLHVIDCRRCQIASDTLKKLNITKLTLQNCDLEDQHLMFLKNLKNLRQVNLDGNCFLSERGLVDIVLKMPQLRVRMNMQGPGYADLSCNSLTLLQVHNIVANLSDLTNLSISECNIGLEAALLIAKKMQYLIFLNVSRNNIPEEGIRALAKNCRRIVHLDISQIYIGFQAMMNISTQLARLKSLKITLSNKSGGNRLNYYLSAFHRKCQLNGVTPM